MLDEQAKQFFRDKGKKGGKRTKRKYGKKHFSEIAKKRWNKPKEGVDKSP